MPGSLRCITQFNMRRLLSTSCKVDLLISQTHISLYSLYTYTHLLKEKHTPNMPPTHKHTRTAEMTFSEWYG